MYKPVYWVEWCLASIFALNTLYHIMQYTWAILNLKPITLSSKQRPLLGVSEDDPLFKNEMPQKQMTPEPSPSLNLSCINLSRRSATLGSSVLSDISMQIIPFIILCLKFYCAKCLLRKTFCNLAFSFFKRIIQYQSHFLNTVISHLKRPCVPMDHSVDLRIFL